MALTGGIASGKSTVARYFAELGVSIIDADQIGRELIDNSLKLRNHLVEHFGPSVLKINGSVDRGRLRAIIFANPKDRVWLESLLHPLIYREIKRSIQKATGIYTLVVIPLLFESRTSQLLKTPSSLVDCIQIDRILLVTASRELQIQRAQERDLLEKNQIDAILAAQISPLESITQADDIIHNESTSLQTLRESVQATHKKYLSLLHSPKNSLDESIFQRYYLTFK